MAAPSLPPASVSHPEDSEWGTRGCSPPPAPPGNLAPALVLLGRHTSQKATERTLRPAGSSGHPAYTRAREGRLRPPYRAIWVTLLLAAELTSLHKTYCPSAVQEQRGGSRVQRGLSVHAPSTQALAVLPVPLSALRAHEAARSSPEKPNFYL